MSIAVDFRRRAAFGLGSVAVVWLAGMSFGMSSANAQGYDRQFYVPGGSFSQPGGRYIFVEPGRRSRASQDPLKHRTAEQLRKAPAPPPVKGPLLIAISIADQKLTVYDDGVPIAHSPVSTGTASHPTPMGVFAIIGKERFHRSHLYSAAPMPFMQRITWSGVALHAGVLPGYPASHGCIRMPNDFAIRLYHTTKMGARVIISQHPLSPTEIAHANLFVPTPKPPATPAPLVATATPTPAPALAAAVTPAAATILAPAAAIPAPVVEEKKEPAAAIAPTEQANETPAPVVEAAPAAQPETATAANDGDTEAKVSESDAPAQSEAKPIAAVEPLPPAVDVAAKVEPAAIIVKETPAAVSTPVIADLRPTLAPVAPRIVPQRALRPGAVSVFVSRKERRLYVRKGFEPVFDMPVEIANADKPIGTHVFTAMSVGGDSARWSVVSMPAEKPRTKRVEVAPQDVRGKKHKGSKTVEVAIADTRPVISAAEALDRITMPKEAVERISALMSVGASLIISDQGLGSETGLETDFVVVTREYEAMPRDTQRARRPRPRQPFF